MALYESTSKNAFNVYDGRGNDLHANRREGGKVSLRGNFENLPKSSARMLAYWLIGAEAIELMNRVDRVS